MVSFDDEGFEVKKKKPLNMKVELRKELRHYVKKYPLAVNWIKLWEQITEQSIKDPKLSADALNNCVSFVINELLVYERTEREVNQQN